jgi:hypothetical protein
LSYLQRRTTLKKPPQKLANPIFAARHPSAPLGLDTPSNRRKTPHS